VDAPTTTSPDAVPAAGFGTEWPTVIAAAFRTERGLFFPPGNIPGKAADAVRIISDADISITYMYTFLWGGKGILIFRTDQTEKAHDVILQHHLSFIDENDLAGGGKIYLYSGNTGSDCRGAPDHEDGSDHCGRRRRAERL